MASSPRKSNASSAIAAGSIPSNLGAPAMRALAAAGVSRLEHLTKFTEREITDLHGVGPTAIAKLKLALRANKLSFAPAKKK